MHGAELVVAGRVALAVGEPAVGAVEGFAAEPEREEVVDGAAVGVGGAGQGLVDPLVAPPAVGLLGEYLGLNSSPWSSASGLSRAPCDVLAIPGVPVNAAAASEVII